MQEISHYLWDKKYRLRAKDGTIVDQEISDTKCRVAKALASVEQDSEYWFNEFMYALDNGAIPAGRIWSNAGAGEHKPATSLINCTVSSKIDDSIVGIMNVLSEAAQTLKAGCGIGYEFSTLRPKGAYVAGAGASTSGPLPFMDIFDAMCKTISSAGGRRGAQMATFDIGHPDIEEYIRAKREDGRLRQFNMSCLITDQFIDAVTEDKEWPLMFDGKVYKTVRAKDLWNLIMRSTYEYSEPGVIFIDRVNQMNSLNWCEDIRTTNPCGEQPLPPNGACLLGSIDLTAFVDSPFGKYSNNNAAMYPEFNWKKYRKVISIFTRMLDNVVELSGLPLEQQRNELEYKRRHGMGITGLGSALTMLDYTYGDEKAISFTNSVCRELAVTGFAYGIDLAKEKGPAPIFEHAGNRRSFVKSKYMKIMPEFMLHEIETYGCRFTHHTSIAPTGTISLVFGNNCSNGIEPSFSHEYSRNLIKEGKKTKEKIDVMSAELYLYRNRPDLSNTLPKCFVNADQIDPKDHIMMQATAQNWIDSSISKTINVPTDYTFEKFKELYMFAYTHGCKGCTTFRYNPEVFQGVLVKDTDLKNTTYKFELSDGSVVYLQGDEVVDYDGETHTAANLYDALKEGYYGRL